MEIKNTAHIDRDKNLSVSGTFNFKGSLVQLREIIDSTIKEYGEDTECKLNTFGRFPNTWSAQIILTNKKLKS